MKKIKYIIPITIIMILILTILLYKKDTNKNNEEKVSFSYTINIQESKNPQFYEEVGWIGNKTFFFYNLEKMTYKTSTKEISIVEPLQEGYLTVDILKLQMKKEETTNGELYRYDGTGNIGTSKFSLYIKDYDGHIYIIFSTYDYNPE